MNSTIFRRVLVLAASLIGVGWAALAQADSFKFPLTGEQCVPPVATSGRGEVELTYDPATRVVTWNIPYSGLSSAVTLAHFHGPAIPGKSGPVIIHCRRLVRERAHPVPSRVRAARSGGPSEELIASAVTLSLFGTSAMMAERYSELRPAYTAQAPPRLTGLCGE